MRAYLLLGVAALSLGACKPDRDTTPAADQAAMTAGAPFDILLAPAYADLPPAPEPVPVLYAPQPVAYDYWNDAYDMNQAYYDQPPSYYNYAGATPLVWTQPYQQPQQQSLTDTLTNFAITRIVEALVGGGQREYYYQPGNEYPYFVRDPQYAYAIDDGRLVALYDPYGRVQPQPMLMQQAPVVSRYLYRADNLYDAALAAALQPLAPDVWRTQRVVLLDDLDDNEGWRSTWIPGANRSPVAIQRLAEVRARKEARDEAHAAWKAQLMASRPKGKALKFVNVERDDRKTVRVGKDDDDRGGPNADRADKRDPKPQKRAEVSQGQAKRVEADKPKGGNDRKGDDGGGKGNGKGGDKGNGDKGGKKD